MATARKKSQKSRQKIQQSLRMVQKIYPGVTKVIDGKDHLQIDVTPRDTASKAVKNHSSCALAVACKRAMELDGAIIARSVAYLVKGNQAVRYSMQDSTTREIVAFDRGATFEPGKYQLKDPRESAKIGARADRGRNGRGGGPTTGGMLKRFQHITENVRANLNSGHVV